MEYDLIQVIIKEEEKSRTYTPTPPKKKKKESLSYSPRVQYDDIKTIILRKQLKNVIIIALPELGICVKNVISLFAQNAWKFIIPKHLNEHLRLKYTHYTIPKL